MFLKIRNIISKMRSKITDFAALNAHYIHIYLKLSSEAGCVTYSMSFAMLPFCVLEQEMLWQNCTNTQAYLSLKKNKGL